MEEAFNNSPIGDKYNDLIWDDVENLPQYIQKGNEEKLRRTLIHEIQHNIQNKEGFATGAGLGDPNYFKNAGEVEARLAARRSMLRKPGELKEISPFEGLGGYDVSPEKQIVEFRNNGLANALKYRDEWVKIGNKDYRILNLPKKDYGKILHSLDTNIKIDDNIGDVLTRYDDKYAYTFQKTAPTEYKFIKRRKIK